MVADLGAGGGMRRADLLWGAGGNEMLQSLLSVICFVTINWMFINLLSQNEMRRTLASVNDVL